MGNITVRLWNQAELEKAASGEDLKLTTLLINNTSFSSEEMKAFNLARQKGLVRTYQALWANGESDEDWDGVVEPVEFRAPNDEMAKWFLSEQYHTMPETLAESTTTYREVGDDPRANAPMEIVVVIRGGCLSGVLCERDARVTLMDFDDADQDPARAQALEADLLEEQKRLKAVF